MIKYIAFVSRQYHWLHEPLTALHRKYFDVPITFFSDRLFESDHEVLKVFPEDCKLYKEPVGKLITDELKKIKEPIIGFIFMDFLPQEPMNFDRLNQLAEYMIDKPIARANLWDNAQWQIEHEIQGEKEDFNIVRLDPKKGQIGCTSLMPALWSRDFLIEFIEDDWQLDMIELPGEKKFLRQDKWHSIGTFPGLLNIAHLCYTSDHKLARTSSLKDEDLKYVTPYLPENFTID